MHFVYRIIGISVFLFQLSLSTQNSSLSALYDFLLDGHKPSIRPVLNASDVLEIYIDIKLRQIIKVVGDFISNFRN